MIRMFILLTVSLLSYVKMMNAQAQEQFPQKHERVELSQNSTFKADICPYRSTKTACIAVSMWCRDYCGPPEGNRPISNWYPCGACFGFSW
jgi:hypothetical protein